MHESGMIFNIQHFSLNDGAGIRTVVFFKGCPLDCAWCHNPESKSGIEEMFFYNEKCVMCGKCAEICGKSTHVFSGNTHIFDRSFCDSCGKCADICSYSALEKVGRIYTADEVLDEISKDDIFFGENGGVTFSGGEPFAQAEFLCELLKKCKEKGYSTCVETCGYTSPENIKKCAEYIDVFLYDCKETNPTLHKKYTGKDNALILDNLSLLDKLGKEVVLRCPIIPGINDRKEHYEGIAILADKHPSVKSVELMAYHPLGVCKAHQIGKQVVYSNTEFLDKDALETPTKIISDIAKVEVKIG